MKVYCCQQSLLTASLDGGGTLSNGGQVSAITALLPVGAADASVLATRAEVALVAIQAGGVSCVGIGIPASWALALAIVCIDCQGSLALGALVATRGGVQHTAITGTTSRAAG